MGWFFIKDIIRSSTDHKYIDKYYRGGKWRYIYPDDANGNRYDERRDTSYKVKRRTAKAITKAIKEEGERKNKEYLEERSANTKTLGDVANNVAGDILALAFNRAANNFVKDINKERARRKHERK